MKIVKENKNLDLSKEGLLETVNFIETKLPELVAQKKHYFSKDSTGLPYSIEYDLDLHTCFIILEGENAYLGRGKKKVVYKAINYKPNDSTIVARAEDCTRNVTELNHTKNMNGAEGMFETVGFGRRKENGKRYATIYARLYNKGSLENAFRQGVKLSNYEKMKVALNILKGLESLHTAGLVHRDLGAKNYLIDVPKGKPGKRDVVAVIADLGRTSVAADSAGTRVQANTSCTAPEGLYLDKLKGEDYYKTDIFAVGCLFYRLFYGPKAPWQDFSYVKDVKTPVAKRFHTLSHRVKAHTVPQRKKLVKLHQTEKLSPVQKFEYLILQMLHTSPEKRKTAHELRVKMEKIFAEMA
jgi:serine/threonine protein kinase